MPNTQNQQKMIYRVLEIKGVLLYTATEATDSQSGALVMISSDLMMKH